MCSQNLAVPKLRLGIPGVPFPHSLKMPRIMGVFAPPAVPCRKIAALFLFIFLYYSIEMTVRLVIYSQEMVKLSLFP